MNRALTYLIECSLNEFFNEGNVKKFKNFGKQLIHWNDLSKKIATLFLSVTSVFLTSILHLHTYFIDRLEIFFAIPCYLWMILKINLSWIDCQRSWVVSSFKHNFQFYNKFKFQKFNFEYFNSARIF